MKQLFLLPFFILLSCAPSKEAPPIEWGPSPWPEIRIERINTLLPQAMEAADVDAWLVICRENANDPMADHVGGENAGGTAVFLFYFDDDGFHSLVFSPGGEATALGELQIHDEVVAVERGTSTLLQAAEFIQLQKFDRIAINTSTQNKLADGLSHSQYLALVEAVGVQEASKFVSSEKVIYEWLSVKTPAEVEIMRQAAELTAAWQLEAYEIIEPGVTTDAEVAAFFRRKNERIWSRRSLESQPESKCKFRSRSRTFSRYR